MTKLIHLLDKIKLPFAYDHFAEGESPEPPFMVYMIPSSDNFGADDFAYHKSKEVRIELYTDKKEPKTERKIESVLDKARVFFDTSETWIESEQLYEVVYTFYLGEKWFT